MSLTNLETNQKTLVFIVDDSEDTADLLSHFLKMNEYDTTIFSSGEDLMEVLEDPATVKQPDIILVDLVMPGINGLEVVRRVKSNPKLTYVPIIMVTANGDNQTRLRGLQSGADDFLTKPVSRAELLARVRALLRLKQAYDEKTRLLGQVQEAYHRLETTQSELVETERRKSHMEAMMSTAAGICHEMSQPLTSALITLQLVQQVGGDEQTAEDFATIENSLLKARVILDKLRALTRYETKPYSDSENILDIERSSDNLLLDFETRYGGEDD